ncbi:MAG: hypothetical protein ACFFBS_09335 [Promethearchaeota archaeon]
MKYSGFKQAVLKSGIPLEKTISQYLLSLGLRDCGEYIYERNNKMFSVDSRAVAHADFALDKRTHLINYDFLIECKYKEPNHYWVFASYKAARVTPSVRLEPTTIYLNFPFEKRLHKYGYRLVMKAEEFIEIYNKPLDDFYFPRSIPLTNAATEIVDSKGFKFNPQAINEASHQVVFALCSAIVDNTLSLIEEDMVDPAYAKIFGGNVFGWLGSLIYPVIVTTANLCVIKLNQSINRIKRSKRFNESFRQVDAVLFCVTANTEMRTYIREQFRKNEAKLVQSPYFSRRNLNAALDDLFHLYNTPVLIVRLPAFKRVMKTVLKEMNEYFIELRNFCRGKSYKYG